MGAMEAAARLRSAEGQLDYAQDHVAYIETHDDSLCITLLDGIVTDLDALITATKAVTKDLGDTGAAEDLGAAKEYLDTALDQARAADGGDSAAGIEKLCSGIEAALADVGAMEQRIESLATSSEKVTEIIAAAHAAAKELIGQTKQIQADTVPLADQIDALRKEAGEIADHLEAAVA